MAKRMILLLLLLALLTTACSISTVTGKIFPSPAPKGSPTPGPTNTPAPTATPLPTPTPAPAERISTVGEWLLFIGDYERALEEFQTALDEASDDDTRASALVGLGRANTLLGNFQDAVDRLTEVVDKYKESPAYPSALFHRAQAYRAINNFHDAAIDLGAYLIARPAPLAAFAQEQRGDALRDSGDFQAAIDAYQAAAAAPQLGDTVGLQIKTAKAYAAKDDNNAAVRMFMKIYDVTVNDYTKAQMDLLAGQVYIKMGLPEQAYARYQDAVNNYPRSYDSYSALVALVDAGIDVNELNRALVDYYAGQFGVAIDIFERYIGNDPKHNGTAHYYKALALRQQNQAEDAVREFDALIRDHKGDRFYADAYREKAYTQWAYLDRYEFAAQTLLDFISLYPKDDRAPEFLFEAARIQERGGQLTNAAATWERLMNEYPAADQSYRALFLAAVTNYRLKNYTQARMIFQRALVLATNPGDQAAALFWVGKVLEAGGDNVSARDSWEQAAQRDPTGYYSERARNLIVGKPDLYATPNYDLGYNLDQERTEAVFWMRKTFNLTADTILDALGPLESDPRIQRGDAFYRLGLYNQARDEFDSLRLEVTEDPVKTFVLMNHLLDLGLYKQAILSARQVLTLANLDDASSLDAPIYFNHIRFGAYFKDLVLQSGQDESLNPLFLFSVIRQESLFEGFAVSSAGASGLMQIMPATGKEISSTMGFPANYDDTDLERVVVNIPLGANYLARQREYFNNDLYAALAAYNGGPGNASAWLDLSEGDPDLFLEVIRYEETRKYLMQISDFLNIYNRIYTRTP